MPVAAAAAARRGRLRSLVADIVMIAEGEGGGGGGRISLGVCGIGLKGMRGLGLYLFLIQGVFIALSITLSASLKDAPKREDISQIQILPKKQRKISKHFKMKR